MEFSRSLAKHGIRITFVNTEHIQKQIMDALATKDECDEITGVVADHILGWTMEIAEQKGMRRAAFCDSAAAQLALRSNIQKLIDEGIIDNDGEIIHYQLLKAMRNSNKETDVSFITNHACRKHCNLGWDFIGNKTMQKIFFESTVRNKRLLNLSDWLLCNSAYDLEPAAFDFDPKIIPIGPLSVSNQLGDSVGSFWSEDLTYLNWLDRQPPQSVIYAAFGSTTIFDRIQFHELAMGLELSNRPFFLVVRPDIKGINEAYPEGFLDRVASCGYIINWAPQQKVLGHPSIACFMSHCGWNSTMEGIIAQDEIKSKVLDNGRHKANAMDLKEKAMNSIKEGGGSCNDFNNFVEWLKA
ncbi:hypothetical protein Patl1_21715 [Pistacia atlantica]|uniref:Uncharacterized protein n=1 Tax=Pistacia atlantica TaxID=434234 RepID=A0ACC1BIK4_9ROSI|nr:hypothetical protein Patl1_21715 [Pistacia atlantica]